MIDEKQIQYFDESFFIRIEESKANQVFLKAVFSFFKVESTREFLFSGVLALAPRRLAAGTIQESYMTLGM